MHRVQFQLARRLLNQHRARRDLPREAKHLVVKGGGEEEELDGEAQTAEHGGDIHDVLREGGVIQDLVRLVDHHAYKVCVVEVLTHQSCAKRTDRCDHNLGRIVVVVALHEVRALDGCVLACN